jgi:hypothetical protein
LSLLFFPFEVGLLVSSSPMILFLVMETTLKHTF